MAKLRISAASIRWLCRIDEHIRHCNIRGPFERFEYVAADPLDGATLRSDLADLIRRRLLTVIHYGFDDSRGPDPSRWGDQRLCGTGWSVNPTKRLIEALWPDRLDAA